MGKNRDVDLGIVGDAGLILKSVAEAASGRGNGGAARRKEWLDELRAAERTAIEKRLPQLRSDAHPIHPYRLVSEIDDFLTEPPSRPARTRKSSRSSATARSR